MEYLYEATKRFFANDNWFGEIIGGVCVTVGPLLALWIVAGFGY